MSSTEAAPELAHTDLVRSSELWYRDGTVVIQAGNTVFRVYHGLLSEESQVFEHMFQQAQPHDAPKYDGVPLVQLPDASHEFALLLKLLHKWRFRRDLNNLQFRESAALAVLCDKYCMDDMRSWALTRVKQMYEATSLDEFLESAKAIRKPNADRTEHITAVNLGRRCGLPGILPSGFYHAACTLTVTELITGASSPSGVHVQFDDPADGLLCAEGKMLLTTCFPATSFLFPTAQRATFFCANPSKCESTIARSLEGTRKSFLPSKRNSNFQQAQPQGLRRTAPIISTVMEGTINISGACGTCRAHLTENCRAQQQMVWNEIPAIFGLTAHGTENVPVQVGSGWD
ncbi:hypothetical protein BDV98DRAFT_606597 [Pterulicium gracile]|uniref:BTB domain-containing protein n=1 Tax=Pterulicium gracile TaxID=1884261 RepID=A0A5C3QCP1_9AGAR|nr:hypothetical protein BDV98DRAFT_606597 [Pterula gracilis]